MFSATRPGVRGPKTFLQIHLCTEVETLLPQRNAGGAQPSGVRPLGVPTVGSPGAPLSDAPSAGQPWLTQLEGSQVGQRGALPRRRAGRRCGNPTPGRTALSPRARAPVLRPEGELARHACAVPACTVHAWPPRTPGTAPPSPLRVAARSAAPLGPAVSWYPWLAPRWSLVFWTGLRVGLRLPRASALSWPRQCKDHDQREIGRQGDYRALRRWLRGVCGGLQSWPRG
jgi:hypothetical protein